MALQQFNLNRAGDTPIATLKLSEITPKDWPTPTLPVADATPEYVPVVSYTGGAYGDDVSLSTANSTDDYIPRTQYEKADMMGTPLADDVTRARGSIAPGDPYPEAGDPEPRDPTITALDPDTIVAGSLAPVTVTITGTGFTPWSSIYSGGINEPVPQSKYISPTQMMFVVFPQFAMPGETQVLVNDHTSGWSDGSAAITFT